MSALSRLEGLLRDVVERPMWLLQANRIHPVEFGQALAAEMEANALLMDGVRTVPDLYEVHLHPDNFRNLALSAPELERELGLYLEEAAAEARYGFASRPSVRLIESLEIEPGELRAFSRFSEVVRDLEIANAASQTQAVRLDEIRRLAQPLARLTVVSPGPQKGTRFRVDRSPFRLGRSPDNDAQIQDLRLSRHHAELTFARPRELRIRDLGSTNGTFLNGRPVTGVTTVRPQDRISLGGVELNWPSTEWPRTSHFC